MHAATTNLSILNPSYHWAGLIGLNLKDTATKSNFSLVLKLREASNVSNIILMYITLSTIETCAFRLICLFRFIVDNRGSQQTAVLKYFFVVIIYIINVAKTKIYRSLDNF